MINLVLVICSSTHQRNSIKFERGYDTKYLNFTQAQIKGNPRPTMVGRIVDNEKN